VVLILIGFTASIAQVILLRELLVVFYGNEISMGLMLACWLFWTALGSHAGSLAGSRAGRTRDPRLLMAAVEALIAVVLPATVLAVRASKTMLQTVPGETIGPGAMMVTLLVVLSLFCVLSGALFSSGSRLYAARAGAPAAESTGRVYLLEALGSSLGGLLSGLLLLRILGSLEIAFLLGLANLAAAVSLAVARAPMRRVALATLAAVAVWLAFPGGVPRLEQLSQERLWRGFHLIATRNSAYGNLAVVGEEGSRSVYENGLVLFTAPDPSSAEESVHFALLEQPAPRSLLLIGGGLNGSIAQALQHRSLERIDYVELDPAILTLGKEFFPKEWVPIESDSRVRVHVTDGRLFLKTTSLAFDVIIVNLPDPQTAQLNRFYTLEFFREAAARLTPTGILSFRLTSSEDYMSPELADFLRSIYRSLDTVFPEVRAIPGETVHFFAARREGVLAAGADELVARLRARHLQTEYVREYYFPFRMTPDRMREWSAYIRPDAPSPINRDFAPIAYYFDVALWSGRFHSGYRRFFRAIAAVDFRVLAAAVGGVMALLLAAGLRARTHPVPGPRPPAPDPCLAAAWCTAATGFTLIGLEMLLLLGWQAIYGYVYQQLAIIIAAFMAGMAAGSWAALRFPPAGAMRALGRWQLAVSLAPLVLCGLFEAFTRVTSPAGLFVVSQIVFPALALSCGILGGYEFPLASRIFFAAGRTRGTGTLYALDLAGSCLGAILFSAWLVPVFGFFKTAVLSALVSMAPAALAILSALPGREARSQG